MKKRVAFAKKALCGMTACVIAATMSLASVSAFAESADLTSGADQAPGQGSGSNTPAIVSEEVALEGSSASQAAESNNASPTDSNADVTAVQNVQANDSANAVTVSDDSSMEIATADVALSDDEATTVVVDAGLMYVVNSEDPTQVTLTGWSGKAPTGELAIPAVITNGGTTYDVTNISSYINLGGGVRSF